MQSNFRAAQVWDPVAGSLAGEPLIGHSAGVSSVAFGTTPDGRLLLASSSTDGTVWVWDPAAGRPVWGPFPVNLGASSVALWSGPDGRLLLLASGFWLPSVWDLVTGSPVWRPLTGLTDEQALSVALGSGPDGLLLASGCVDGVVRMSDPVTGRPVGQPLISHTGRVPSVAFGTAQDGRLVLASGSTDQTVRLWDVASRTSVATLNRRSSVYSVATVGTLLAVGDEEGVSVIELEL